MEGYRSLGIGYKKEELKTCTPLVPLKLIFYQMKIYN